MTTGKIIAFIIIALCLIIQYVVLPIRNARWRKKPLHNFKFFWRGQEFWYSRACAATHFVFCKNTEGKWCILANKRGIGTPDFQGFWNASCGYLDFNESGEQCAQRETYEETGLFVPLEEIKFWNVNTHPSANKQNVTLRYVSVLHDKNCDTFKMATDNSEENEVAEIKWIPIDEVENYGWAFNHKEIILSVFNKIEK